MCADSSICAYKCDNHTKNVADNLKITWIDLNNATTINTDSGKNLNYYLLLLIPMIWMLYYNQIDGCEGTDINGNDD